MDQIKSLCIKNCNMTICSNVLAKLREEGFKVGSCWRKVVKNLLRMQSKSWKMVGSGCSSFPRGTFPPSKWHKERHHKWKGLENKINDYQILFRNFMCRQPNTAFFKISNFEQKPQRREILLKNFSFMHLVFLHDIA